MHGEYSTILVQINAWILSIGIKAGALKKKTRQYTTIIPTLVHASAWVVPTLVQANAWIVPSLFQAIAWIVPNHSRRGQCLDSIDWNICRCKKKRKMAMHNADGYSLQAKAWIVSTLVHANAWIVPTLVYANAWIVSTLVQANAWIVTTLFQTGAWTVPTAVSSPSLRSDPFPRRPAAFVLCSTSVPSRCVCVLFRFRAAPPRRFRAVPPRPN